MKNSNTSAVVLAAGKSTRIKSEKSKLLHEVVGKPVICHLVGSLLNLGLKKIVLILGHQQAEIKKILETKGLLSQGNFEFVEQIEQLGTGHAVKCALPNIEKSGRTLILAGDVPLLKTETLSKMISETKDEHLLSVLVATLENPKSYGRVIDNDGFVTIVEEKDATDSEREVKQINSGIYAVENSFLKEAIGSLGTNNVQKEYYLTDIVKMASERKKGSVKICEVTNSDEVMGMNDRLDLYKVSKSKRVEINEKWMKEGVTIFDPEGTIIEESVELSHDVEIYPGSVLKGKTKVGSGTILSSGTHLIDAIIGENVLVRPYCVVDSSQIKNGVAIGPFAHVRPGCDVGENAKIGNFVELKKVKLGNGSKASHLTYLGDAEIGKNVNIGCGVITCNYDGENKHKTIVEDDVFIGSDNQLVAPVTVGKGAYTASGSTITKDVPAGALAVARTRQENKEGYVEKIKAKRKKGKK